MKREDIAQELSLHDYSMDTIELACNGAMIGPNLWIAEMFTEIPDLRREEHGELWLAYVFGKETRLGDKAG